jgi:hypothetical protein
VFLNQWIRPGGRSCGSAPESTPIGGCSKPWKRLEGMGGFAVSFDDDEVALNRCVAVGRRDGVALNEATVDERP